jgi:hypothetical protein
VPQPSEETVTIEVEEPETVTVEEDAIVQEYATPVAKPKRIRIRSSRAKKVVPQPVEETEDAIVQ